MEKKTICLENMNKQNPFQTPPDYFNNLTDNILSQLPEKVGKETKVVSMWDKIKPWVYMAAMFTGIALMLRLFIGTPPTLDLTSSADIEQFYQYYEEQLVTKSFHEDMYLCEDCAFNDDDAE